MSMHKKAFEFDLSCKWYHLFVGIAFLILAFICYANVLHGEFQFDDHEYIVKNSSIHDITDISAIYSTLAVPTRFIAFLTFALNYHVHQLDVFGYHLVNILIHAMNAFLIYYFLRLIFSSEVLANKVGRRDQYTICVLAGMLFVAHPLNTQAVSYITQRFTSLATLFYLLTLSAYVKARMCQSRGRWFFMVAVISGVCAMLTKQISMTLPIMIVMCELYFFRQDMIFQSRNRRIALSIILVSLLLLIPGLYSFKVWGILTNQLASHSHIGDVINGLNYAWTQLSVIGRYVQLFVWPVGQNLDYDFALTRSLFDFKSWLLVGVWAGMVYAAVYQYNRRPLLSFAIAWFLITLSVDSGFIPIQHVIFEHRMYLPSIGLIIGVVYLFSRLLRDHKVYVAVFSVVVLALTVLTIQRNQVWQTEVAMWTDVVKKSPKKSRGYLNLGRAYLQKGKTRRGLVYLSKAIELNPQDVDAYNQRGLYLYRNGLHAMALDDFNLALQYDPRATSILVNRGNLFRRIGEYDMAMKDFNSALSVRKDDYRIYVNRGNVFAKLRQFDKALNDFQTARQLNPKYVDILKNIGNAYEFQGEYEKALGEYKKLAAIKPTDDDIHVYMGTVYSRLSEFSLALDSFGQAIEINPERGDAYYKRSFLHYDRKQYDLALDDIMRAQFLRQKVDPKYISRVKRALGK